MHPSIKRLTVARRRLRCALPALFVLAASAALAIANAERVDAASLAPVELGQARAKLSAAEKAVAEKEMIAGAQLADQARADAELAAARTGAAKAKAVNADIKHSIATLEEEMQRKTGEAK